MSANFNPAADAWLTGTAGAAGPLGTGAYTIATLYRAAAANDGLTSLRAAGSEVRGLLQDTFHLFGNGDFSSGDATTTTATWWVGAQTKPAGNQVYRHHAWLYDSTGAGAMTHGVSSGSGNHADGAAIDQIRIGWSANRGNGDIAVMAYWSSELSDAQLNTLRSGSLLAWAALAPQELITFENWNGATGWSTRLGSSALSSITGTVGVGVNPPSFNFNLVASVDLTPASFAFSAVPVTAVPQPITINLVPGVFQFSGVPVASVPGAVTVILTPAGYVFSAVPVVAQVPGTGGVDVEWCASLAPNWLAELEDNWRADLAPNWAAQLVEECT
jgi:hypothetical protein